MKMPIYRIVQMKDEKFHLQVKGSLFDSWVSFLSYDKYGDAKLAFEDYIDKLNKIKLSKQIKKIMDVS
jgi:hypothetical protein